MLYLDLKLTFQRAEPENFGTEFFKAMINHYVSHSNPLMHSHQY